jgi:hypothetical protein
MALKNRFLKNSQAYFDLHLANRMVRRHASHAKMGVVSFEKLLRDKRRARLRGLKAGKVPVGNEEALKARKLLAEVEERELRIAANFYGVSSELTVAVPEPSTYALSGLGALALVLTRRRTTPFSPSQTGSQV